MALPAGIRRGCPDFGRNIASRVETCSFDGTSIEIRAQIPGIMGLLAVSEEFQYMSVFDKMRRQKLLSFSLILFTLSIGVVIGTLVSTGVKAAKDQVIAPGATPLVIPPNPAQMSTAFTQLAKQLEPSVVNISSEYSQKTPSAKSRRRPQQPQQPDDEDDDNGMQDFFERFFGNPFGGPPQVGPR